MLILLLQLCMEARVDAHTLVASTICAFLSVRNVDIIVQALVIAIMAWGRDVQLYIALLITHVCVCVRLPMRRHTHVLREVMGGV